MEAGHRIVKPLPEPDDAGPADHRTYGRWDVTISGTVTVDVGSGDLQPPQH